MANQSKALLLFILVGSMVLFPSQVKNGNTPQKGTWDARIKPVWQTETAGDNPLVRIFPLKVHENGNVYAVDQKFATINIFDSRGKFIKAFGKRGEGPGEFKHALDLHLLKDRLILVDIGQIVVFSLDGGFEKSYKISNHTGTNPLFFLDPFHYLYTPTDPRKPGPPDAIEIFDVKEQSKKVLLDLSPGEDKEPPSAGGQMVMVRIGGAALQDRAGMVLGYDGDSVFYGQNNKYEITEIDKSGKPLMSFSVSGRALKKITQEYKERMVSRMSIRIQSGPSSDEIKKRIMKSIPDECTYFWRIQKLANGLILVYTSDIVREDGILIDMFSPAGQYLYQTDIKVPGAERLNASRLQIAGGFLYAYFEDSDGENHLGKFKIHLPKI